MRCAIISTPAGSPARSTTRRRSICSPPTPSSASGGAACRWRSGLPPKTAPCRSSRQSRTGTSRRPWRRLRALKQQPLAEDRARSSRGGALRVCMVHYSDFVVDSRIQRQARALAERGDRVDCVCLNDDAEFAVGPGEIALHRAAAGKPRGGPLAYLEGNARFLAGAARKVSALDRHARFDLVEIHNMPDALVFAALRPKLRGTPLVLNFHDAFPELFATLFDRPAGHPLVRLIRAEERLSAALADGHVFVTDEARQLLRSRGVGAKQTRVVMNTPDERVFGERRSP